jgi:anti-anti-sigma factor
MECRGAVTVARVRESDLADKAASTAFAEQLHSLANGPGGRLVLNLGQVYSISSTTVGRLLGLHNQVHRAGGVLALCELTPPVSRLFRLLALGQVFDVFAEERDALRSLMLASRGGSSGDLRATAR